MWNALWYPEEERPVIVVEPPRDEPSPLRSVESQPLRPLVVDKSSPADGDHESIDAAFQELERDGDTLKNIRKALGEPFDIPSELVTDDQIAAGISLLRRLMEARAADARHVEYGYMSDSAQQVFQALDPSGSGHVSLEAIQLARQPIGQGQLLFQTNQNQSMARLAGIAMIGFVLLLCGVFLVSLLTANITKEFGSKKMGQAALMVSVDGDTVLTGSRDFRIDNQGNLIARHSLDEQPSCLGSAEVDCNQVDGAVATAESLVEAQVFSTSPSVLLKQIRFLMLLGPNEDRSSDVQSNVFVVDGATSLEAAGTHCRRYVILATPKGNIHIIDDSVFLSESLSATFRRDAMPTGNGYIRLAEGSIVVGLFNQIPATSPPCNSTAEPPRVLQTIIGAPNDFGAGDLYFHLSGNVTTSCIRGTSCKGVMHRDMFVGPHTTFLVDRHWDDAEENEQVLVLDRPTASMTRFERKRGFREAFYCSRVGSAPLPADFIFKHGGVTVDGLGARSVWLGRLPGASANIVEIEIGLDTGLPARIRGVGPFRSAFFSHAETVDQATFIRRLSLRSPYGNVESWGDCWSQRSLADIGIASSDSSVGNYHKGDTFGAEAASFGIGEKNGEEIFVPHAAFQPYESQSSQNVSVALLSEDRQCLLDTSCVTYTIAASDLEVCVVTRLSSASTGCQREIQAQWRLQGSPTISFGDIEFTVVTPNAMDTVSHAGAMRKHTKLIPITVVAFPGNKPNLETPDLRLEVPEQLMHMSLVFSRMHTAGDTVVARLSGLATGANQAVITAPGVQLHVNALQHVEISGTVGNPLVFRHKIQAFVDLGWLGLLDAEFGSDESLVAANTDFQSPGSSQSLRSDAVGKNDAFPPQHVYEDGLDKKSKTRPPQFSSNSPNGDRVGTVVVPSEGADVSPQIQTAYRIRRAASLMANLTWDGSPLPGCSSLCSRECTLELECPMKSCQESTPWCGILKQLDVERANEKWISLGELSASVGVLLKHTENAQPAEIIAKNALANIASMLTIFSDPQQLIAPPDAISRLASLDMALSGGGGHGVWSGSNTARLLGLQLVHDLLIQDLVRQTQLLPPRGFKFATSSGEVLLTKDIGALLASSMLEAADAHGLAQRLVQIVGYDSLVVDFNYAQQTLAVKIFDLSASLTFSGQLPMRLFTQELSLYVSTDAYEVPKVSHNHAELQVTAKDSIQIRVERQEDALVLRPISPGNDQLYLIGEAFENSKLPAWTGLRDAAVREMRWRGGNEYLMLVSFISPHRIAANHIFVSDFWISGDVVCKHMPSVEQEMPSVAIDWVNVTLAFQGASQELYFNIDGEHAGNLGFPEIRISMNMKEAETVHRRVLFAALRNLNFNENISARSSAVQTSFDWNLAAPSSFPKNAFIDDVQVVIRETVFQDVDEQQHLLSRGTGSQGSPSSTVLVVDRLLLQQSIGAKSNRDARLEVVLPDAGLTGYQLRDFLVPGLVFPVIIKNGAIISDAIEGYDLPPVATLDTLSRHIANRLCLVPTAHKFSFKKMSAVIPLQQGADPDHVELVLVGVAWQPHGQSSAFPMIGHASVSFSKITLQIPTQLFHSEPLRASELGGDTLLDHLGLQLGLHDPRLTLPGLQVRHLALATQSAGHTDGLGQRLSDQNDVWILDGTKIRCPELEFRADGLPLFESRIFRRRIGKVAFGRLSATKLLADQDVNFSCVRDAELFLRLKAPMELRCTISGGVALLNNEISAPPIEDCDVSCSAGSTNWVEKCSREVCRGCSACRALAFSERGDSCRNGSGAAEGEVLLPRSLRISIPLKHRDKSVDFLSSPTDHVVYSWENEVSIHTDVVTAVSEAEALQLRIDQVLLKEHAAKLVSQLSLNGTVEPVMIPSEFKPNTCEDMGCRAIRAVSDCETAARKLGLADVVANRAGLSEREIAPAGCYYAEGGQWSGLWHNDLFASKVGARENNRGGWYRPICECSPGDCPVHAFDIESSPTDMVRSVCSMDGDVLPNLKHAAKLTSNAAFNANCLNAVRNEAFDNPLDWGSSTPSFNDTMACNTIELTGPLHDKFDRSNFWCVARTSDANGEYQIESETIKLKAFYLPGFGKLSFLPGKVVWSSMYGLAFVARFKIESTFLKSKLEDLFSFGTDADFTLIPSTATIKMQIGIDIRGNMNFAGFYAAVGFTIGVPVGFWPSALRFESAPTVFVHIGSKDFGGGLAVGPTAQLQVGTIIHDFTRIVNEADPMKSSVYGCGQGSFPSFDKGSKGSLRISFPGSIDEQIVHLNRLGLDGIITFTMSKAFLGATEDIALPTQVTYNSLTKELSVHSTREGIKWIVPSLDIDVILGFGMLYRGSASNFTPSHLELYAKGCGFGMWPFRLGRSFSNLLFQADLRGTWASGLGWEIVAAAKNVDIDHALSDESVLIVVSESAGLSVKGVASVELPFLGLQNSPHIVVPLTYENGVFSANGVTTSQIFPASWGLDPAEITIRYDNRAVTKANVSVQISGTLQAKAIWPGALDLIPISAFGSLVSEFKVASFFDVRLPEILNSRTVQIDVTIDKDQGLRGVGVIHNLGITVASMPQSLAEQGLHDVIVNSATLIISGDWRAVASAGNGEDHVAPQAAIWIQASVGELSAEGLLVLSAAPCLVLQTAPETTRAFLSTFDFAAKMGIPTKIALCRNADVLEDVELPSVAVASNPEVRQGLVAETTPKAFMAMLGPLTSAQFSAKIPLTVTTRSLMNIALDFVGLPSRSFELSLTWDADNETGAATLICHDVTWANRGPLEEARLNVRFDINISSTTLSASSEIVAGIKIRVDPSSGQLLHFKGVLAVSEDGVFGTMPLSSPGVLRVISKRFAIALSQTNAPLLQVSSSTTLGRRFTISGPILMSAEQNLPMAIFNAEIGDKLHAGCIPRADCRIMDFEISMSWGLAGTTPIIDKAYLRFTGEAIGMPSLLQSIIGSELPSAVRGSLAKWIGETTLFVLDYGIRQQKIFVSGATVAMGVGLLFSFFVSLGIGKFAVEMQIGISKGCLGRALISSCQGMVLESAAPGALEAYRSKVQNIKTSGWGNDTWLDSYLPVNLRNSDQLASYGVFKIHSTGINIDLSVIAKLSVGFVNLDGILPVAQPLSRLQYVRGHLRISGAAVNSALGFGTFLGSLSHTVADRVAEPSGFGYLRLALDTSLLEPSLKHAARDAWSPWWFSVADSTLKIFNVLDIMYLNADVTSNSVSLSSSFKFSGLPVRYSAALDIPFVGRALDGDLSLFSAVGSDQMFSGRLDSCVPRAEYGNFVFLSKDIKRTGGTYKQYYGYHEKCGGRVNTTQSCGYNCQTCTFDLIQSCSYEWCCIDVTLGAPKKCFYKDYVESGGPGVAELEYPRVEIYQVTYGPCSISSRCEFEFQQEDMDCKNYRLLDDFDASFRWKEVWYSGGFCDDAGACPM